MKEPTNFSKAASKHLLVFHSKLFNTKIKSFPHYWLVQISRHKGRISECNSWARTDRCSCQAQTKRRQIDALENYLYFFVPEQFVWVFRWRKRGVSERNIIIIINNRKLLAKCLYALIVNNEKYTKLDILIFKFKCMHNLAHIYVRMYEYLVISRRCWGSVHYFLLLKEFTHILRHNV